MKQYLAGIFLVALAMVAVVPTQAKAETQTSNVSSLFEMMQSLMKQVEALQKQLAALKGQINEELKDGLKEGVTDEDVKKIQELLATDPTIYPKGLVSGYYGPLTTDAIKALQKRNGLDDTGMVDAKTKALLLEYFKEKSGGKIPPGLLKAPGIDKKIKDRMEKKDGSWYLDCDEKKAAGPLCKNRDDEDEDDDDGKDDEDEDDDGKDDDDYSKDRTGVLSQRAIDAAEVMINNLEAAIADAEDEDLVEDAEEELDEATEYLEKAEEFFKAKKYTFATSNAVKARRTAEKAIDALVKQDDPAAAGSAQSMIDYAEEVIADLEDAIADTDDEELSDDSEDKLEEAQDKLADAMEDYDEEEYRKAYDRAVEAKMIALKAIEELEDAE